MIVICPSCLADETSFYDPAGPNFCSECGTDLDEGGGRDGDCITSQADRMAPLELQRILAERTRRASALLLVSQLAVTKVEEWSSGCEARTTFKGVTHHECR